MEFYGKIKIFEPELGSWIILAGTFHGSPMIMHDLSTIVMIQEQCTKFRSIVHRKDVDLSDVAANHR